TARVLAIPVVAVMVLEIAACIALRRGVMRSGAITIAEVRWALSPNPYRAGESLVTAVVAATPIAMVVGHFLHDIGELVLQHCVLTFGGGLALDLVKKRGEVSCFVGRHSLYIVSDHP